MNELEIKEKIAQGWIKSRMWFEVMATNKDLTEKALQAHIEKIKSIENNFVLGERFEEIQEVKNLPKDRDIKQAFSKVVELNLLTKNIEILLFVVITFAPSSVEILEPKEFKFGIDTLQVMLNSVADMMHRFAATGAGGMVIATKR